VLKVTTPEWPEALQAMLDARLNSVGTTLPGIVQSYDASTQRATVRPALRRPVPTIIPGQYRMETLPDVPDVLVLWPRAGSNSWNEEVPVGTGVLLVFCQFDPTLFFATGEVSDPADVRSHALAHAVAILGAAPTPLTGTGLVASQATIGGDTDAAALASQVDTIGRAVAQIIPAVGTGVAADVVAKFNALLTAFKLVYAGPSPTPPGGTCASDVLKVGS
jgi:hypothetical protein